VDGKAKRLAELERAMAEGNVWADPEKARRTVEEVKQLKRWIEPYHALRKRVTDGGELTEMLEAEAHVDLALQRQLEQEADAIGAQLEALELQNMLRGADDTTSTDSDCRRLLARIASPMKDYRVIAPGSHFLCIERNRAKLYVTFSSRGFVSRARRYRLSA